MNPDLLLPMITSLGWLILCGAALTSRRLRWGQLITMALAWVAIFGGLYLIIAWFMVAQDTASALF